MIAEIGEDLGLMVSLVRTEGYVWLQSLREFHSPAGVLRLQRGVFQSITYVLHVAPSSAIP